MLCLYYFTTTEIFKIDYLNLFCFEINSKRNAVKVFIIIRSVNNEMRNFCCNFTLLNLFTENSLFIYFFFKILDDFYVLQKLSKYLR